MDILFQQSANMQMKMSYSIMFEIRVVVENTSSCINRKLFIMNSWRCFDKQYRRLLAAGYFIWPVAAGAILREAVNGHQKAQATARWRHGIQTEDSKNCRLCFLEICRMRVLIFWKSWTVDDSFFLRKRDLAGYIYGYKEKRYFINLLVDADLMMLTTYYRSSKWRWNEVYRQPHWDCFRKNRKGGKAA